MNEWTHLFVKIYLSHFIRKGWCFLCVRGELETETDCHILTPSSFDYSSTSFAFWLGCSTVGPEGPNPLSGAVSHSGILSPTGTATRTPTDPSCLWQLFDVHMLPVGVRICTEFNHVHRSRWYSNILDRMHLLLPLIYTGASLDWRLGRGPICNNLPILIILNSTCGIFLHVRLRPPHTQILQMMLKDNNSKKYKKKLLEPQQKIQKKLKGDLLPM